jgi:hypothetical protein
MKKLLLTLLSLNISVYGFSQEKSPTYSTVLRNFFSKYVAIHENEDYTSFAKKRDGS